MNGNYTREDSDHNRSFIDHFLLSKNVSHTNFTITLEGDNLSDHHPISIDIMYTLKLLHVDNSSYRIMNWSKASNANISTYKTHLNHYLRYFKIPHAIKNCNNLFCKSHNEQILQLLDNERK